MSFGGFSGSGGSSGGTSAAPAASAGAGSGAGAGGKMSFQDMLAKLGGMFGGGEPQQPAELQVSDPGAQSAALAQQMMQVLPALQRRGVLGLGRR